MYEAELNGSPGRSGGLTTTCSVGTERETAVTLSQWMLRDGDCPIAMDPLDRPKIADTNRQLELSRHSFIRIKECMSAPCAFAARRKPYAKCN